MNDEECLALKLLHGLIKKHPLNSWRLEEVLQPVPDSIMCIEKREYSIEDKGNKIIIGSYGLIGSKLGGYNHYIRVFDNKGVLVNESVFESEPNPASVLMNEFYFEKLGRKKPCLDCISLKDHVHNLNK